VGAAVLAVRWTRSPAWRGLHTAAALTAALLGHTVVGLLTLVHTPLDRIALVVFGLAEAALLGAAGPRQRCSLAPNWITRPFVGRQARFT
jgi:hypothetical protein